MSSEPSVKQISTVFELQSLVDSHQHPFVVIDRDYKILAVNKAYEKTYGIGKERTIGMPCFKLSHDNDAPCCKSGEDCPHEFMFKHGESAFLHTYPLRRTSPYAPGAGDRPSVAQW